MILNYLKNIYLQFTHYFFISNKFKGCTFGKNCEFIAPNNIEFGKPMFVGKNSYFNADGGFIQVGNRTAFNMNVHINSSIGGRIIIGDNCLIGPNVVMRTANHIFENIDVPIRLQGHKCEDIIIMDNVWVGSNVVILGGVTIESGAVIGAGAVVTKNIPSNSIAIGVPAKVKRLRDGVII